MSWYRLLTGIAAPGVAGLMAVHPRTRPTWTLRWGWRVPPVPPGAVWIHAASMGEGEIARALFQPLRRRLPGQFLLRTATSDTGLSQRCGAHASLPLPVDLPAVVGPWLDQVRPRVLVSVEQELWPHLLSACKARGIPVVVVGTRDTPGFRRLRESALWPEIQAAVSAWVPRQDLPGLGGGVGSLKGAALTPLDLPLDTPVLVGVSTRPGDEDRLLQAWSGQGTLVIAPRHPERFEAVAAALPDPFARRSKGELGRLLLWDTLGELGALIPQADAVVIGGSFDPEIGGHSPLEALRAGVPVVHGPHTHSDPESFAHPGCIQVSEQGLAEGIQRALACTVKPLAMSGLEPTVAVILEHLGATPPPGPQRPWLSPLDRVWSGIAQARVGEGAQAALPVISVGALSAGGSGKTPLSAWIAQWFNAREMPCAVVARGYLRGPGPQVRSEGDLGDELRMLKERGLDVVSSPDRLAGIQWAKEQGARVVVLDDGFQHHAVRSDLSLLMVDPQDPLDGGVIPVGRAREGLESVARADLVVLNGAGEFSCERPTARVHTTPCAWIRDGQQLPLDQGPKGPIAAFCGIARPGRFLQTLLDLGVDVQSWHPFPDHHPFTPAELPEGERICTEKDLPRLPPGTSAWALKLTLSPADEVLESHLQRFARAHLE
ncbi:MAG: tetraacyldisaccharide 4'-kinase [Myxococcota bacterium]|nr:tetraacyldisaccharide 4'-kinase [Myxococcota bacterium]